MDRFDRFVRTLHRYLLVVAGLALAAMILLTIGNIGSRLVWAPIKGTVELTGFLGAIAAAFALGTTQLKGGHTSVDILVLKYPRWGQRLLPVVGALLGAGFFCLAGWQLVRWGTTLQTTGEVTETLRVIYYPFVYAVALGCFAMVLALLIQCLKAFRAQKGDR
jgi:TRAP-type C4-dicarboxylate transport system permease small subunit